MNAPTLVTRTESPLHERPLAARGLTSYRYGLPGNRFIMIGAKDNHEALSECARSMPILEKPVAASLQLWDGKQYVFVYPD